MKALLPTGHPDAMVVLGDAEEPRPAPDEALVKVEAFSVNRGEVFRLHAPRPGQRPGKDIAGLVVQAAADGSGPRAGQRIVGHPAGGGWAEYAAVRTDALAVLPDGVSSIRAAALPLAGLTALRLLRTTGCVSGHPLLLTGASGGVGHYFTELAVGAGAEVTAVTATPERGRRLAEFGATVVHDLADARGPFHTVLESVGGASTARALALLRPRGTLIWFGQASREPAELSFFAFFQGPRSAAVRHFHYEHFDEAFGPDLAALVRLVANDRLHPEIGRLAAWQDTAATLNDLRDRRIAGNAVLTIGQ
ncbi:zinc-binding dehydrogenase [Streptomyces sp. SPB162]|uniref:zinc-binding dehydrogenase n=1 Tax=Streptomyces sp. SPB162 TaxID=2940560 RepID=UPI0024074950|nr:zinc-binding dehydrogenase [Streptomyces sp. SPB162]MDF9816287.1 NADPH2:quinone reductase [Streptomyces sp. SPB162]